LHELAPRASEIAALLNRANPNAKPVAAQLQQAAAQLGVQLDVREAVTDSEIEVVYTALKPGNPLLIGTDPSFFARRASFIALSARHRIPTMYDNRESVDAGGLIGYGQNTESSWEQAGIYVGRILMGAKPAELPVMQPVKFEFVINVGTAKALGIEVPLAMQARADEVIE
jgi:ABC-type uncharacterized transport system substrate-binding protein